MTLTRGLLVLLLATSGCMSPYEARPLPATHPASDIADAAPMYPASSTLTAKKSDTDDEKESAPPAHDMSSMKGMSGMKGMEGMNHAGH
jgi:hypothetical protein